MLFAFSYDEKDAHTQDNIYQPFGFPFPFEYFPLAPIKLGN